MGLGLPSSFLPCCMTLAIPPLLSRHYFLSNIWDVCWRVCKSVGERLESAANLCVHVCGVCVSMRVSVGKMRVNCGL